MDDAKAVELGCEGKRQKWGVTVKIDRGSQDSTMGPSSEMEIQLHGDGGSFGRKNHRDCRLDVIRRSNPAADNFPIRISVHVNVHGCFTDPAYKYEIRGTNAQDGSGFSNIRSLIQV